MNQAPLDQPDLKLAVQSHWDSVPCGTTYATGEDLRQQLESQFVARYELEPYLPEFARFQAGAGKDVLEIGVGMGADHLRWARSKPRSLSGVDLTPAGIVITETRLRFEGLKSNLMVGDAERLSLPDNSFDLVFSWGVLHHSPNTPQAIREVYRVLRPGGRARVMIYHRFSIVGYMLWTRYALMKGHPGRGLTSIYAQHLESPGTKAYTVPEARELFKDFSQVDARTLLSFGDLLQGDVGQRHHGKLLSIAKSIWPRPIIRTFFKNHGLYLLIDAVK